MERIKFKGKLLAFLLAVGLLISGVPTDDVKAANAETEEAVVSDTPFQGAGNNMSNATTIYANNWYYGTIDNSNTTDFYKITLTSAGRLYFNAEAEMTIRYALYDIEAKELTGTTCSYNDVMGKSSYEKYVDLTKGTYYFSVTQVSKNSEGNYSFQYQFKSAGESFTENQGGSDNNMIVANKIDLGRNYKGQIAANDFVDFYKFTIKKAGAYTLNIDAKMLEVEWTIYDEKGNEKYSKFARKDDALGKIKSEIEIEITSQGTYYICFNGKIRDDFAWGGYSYYIGNYTFNIATKLNPVYIDTIKNSASGVKVSWGRVNNATSYVIYRKAGSGAWKKLATTSSVSSYVDKTTKSGVTYSYKIYPTMGSVTGKNGNVKKMTYVAQVKPTYVKSNGKGKLTLKWKADRKASGYQIQYATNKKFSGEKIQQVSKSKKNYTITKLKSRKNYYVRIRAVKKVKGIKYYSVWSKAKKVRIR